MPGPREPIYDKTLEQNEGEYDYETAILDQYVKWKEEDERKRAEGIGERVYDEFKSIEDEFEQDIPYKEWIREWRKIQLEGFSFNYFQRYFVAFRWIINFFCVGVPWLFTSIAAAMWLIVFNAWLNKMWAGWNVWLLINTAYGLLQIPLTWPLMFEFVFYLRHMKFVRYISWFAAVCYFFVYILLLTIWLFEIYAMTPQDYQSISPLDVLWNMFFIYNTILHAGNALVSLVIIVKEFELEFYNLVTVIGGEDSRYNLGWKDAFDFWD